ncbi:MAG TPA: M20/M25/M40 family metallo-hydrolase [Desertimonas sp.]|nr:M20/M25/M40 family metallo-hydrolase [Desertimonas sp.]
MRDARFGLDEMVGDLGRLVNVESPSHEIEALTRSANVLADLIRLRLGSDPELIVGPAGPHVHWRGGDRPRVLVVGHHDTVFPLGTLAARPFTVGDGRATGPGVFDMKGGIVTAIHAVASLADRAGVELLFTCDEEVGSLTSRQLIEERATACGGVLVLEPAADGGALKVGRKGVGMYSVEVGGRAAHAGLEPEKGVNALVEAAHQVLAITTIAQPAEGTTVTPTVARAGTAENVVPATATIRVDVRVTSLDEARRVDKEMAALSAVDPQATILVSGGVNRPPMPVESSVELFAAAERAAEAVGIGPVDGVSVGGGSDGNFTAAIGIPTLDGLGVVGGGAHADHEWVDVASLPERAALLAALITSLT